MLCVAIVNPLPPLCLMLTCWYHHSDTNTLHSVFQSLISGDALQHHQQKPEGHSGVPQGSFQGGSLNVSSLHPSPPCHPDGRWVREAKDVVSSLCLSITLKCSTGSLSSTSGRSAHFIHSYQSNYNNKKLVFFFFNLTVSYSLKCSLVVMPSSHLFKVHYSQKCANSLTEHGLCPQR